LRCEHCGTDNAKRNKYCRNCGGRIRPLEVSSSEPLDCWQPSPDETPGVRIEEAHEPPSDSPLVPAAVTSGSLDALVGGPIEDFAAAVRQWETSAHQFRAEDDKPTNGNRLEHLETRELTEETPPSPVLTSASLADAKIPQTSETSSPGRQSENRFSREQQSPATVVRASSAQVNYSLNGLSAVPASQERPTMRSSSATGGAVPPISGPSFLGLSEEQEDPDRYDYLLEDDGDRHIGRWLLLLLLVAGLAAGYWKRDEIRDIANSPDVAPIVAKIRAAVSLDSWIASSKTSSAQQQTSSSEQRPVNLPASTQDTAARTPDNPTTEHAASDEASLHKRETSEPSRAVSTAAPASTDAGQAENPKAVPGTEKHALAAKEGNRAGATPAAELAPAEKPTPQSPASQKAEETSGKRASAVIDTPPDSVQPRNAARQDPLLVAGEEYLYGRGGRHNCQKALSSFRASAEQGNPEAMSHLGAMYATGHCVTRDRVLAYQYFARAEEAGSTNPWISRNLIMLWREMGSDERHLITSARGR